MSTDGTPPGRRSDAARVLTLDLEELIWALNSRDPLGESRHWLNIESGTIQSLIGPDADDEADGDPRDDDRRLFIEPIESSEAFRVMEDFVDQCGDDRLARALGQALQQRKPFRRFKDVLAAHPAQREAWFAFERQAMEAIARRWCEDHGISPRWAARPSRPTP
ncbi:MAG TPA: UPF0158 family protein [Rubrivivax sp.]|nr:hypothetical protein [Pseudomonadota bacterium]HOW47479.1 UPF0158 family protein [Rubrivivax sp.]HRY86414.1 UPF0158 family protein [Rubrivivax sp.]HRZ59088.1 UPF0158 family protein [Rubrivivax sp.]